MLLSNKKEQTIDTHHNVGRSQGHYTNWKSPSQKCSVVYNSIYVTFSKWWNYRNEKYIHACQGQWIIGEDVGGDYKWISPGRSL